MWGVRGRVQVFKKKLYTHIHLRLCYNRISILYKKIYFSNYRNNECRTALVKNLIKEIFYEKKKKKSN